MGIKSTHEITRKQAESMTESKLNEQLHEIIGMLKHIESFSDKDLEDYLEIGQEFTNYLIIESPYWES